ncbi:MAG: TfpX/TfpZ family type IV pilin accessory protein [Hylemonella sp.]|uniref:TfpX/TfpZ family type IV pilin accessory protein n=1 Tax=Hylemonella sp. TaxID=2066020 RepID=UPI00391ADE3C
MKEESSFRIKDRLHASSIHMGASLIIGSLAAWLVFALWYPYPYREISGGKELFIIIISVDVILGPLITFTVFNRHKQQRELLRDLSIVVAIQIAALFYGMWIVCAARPVHLVFELDRFRVVHAIEVQEELLPQVSDQLKVMPLTGPTLMAVRPFRDANEQVNATMLALQGVHLSARPDLWQDYREARGRVLTSAQLAADLKQRFPEQVEMIDQAILRTGKSEGALLYLPLISRDIAWTVLLDISTAEILGFIRLDSF